MTVHKTAIIEADVSIGQGTAIWDNVHVRGPTSIGSNCIIGEKTYIAYGVTISDLVKINAFVYVCNGVTIERGAMIAAGTIFTNDVYPRASDAALSQLKSSAPDEHTGTTLVREGATIGAGARIGTNLEIGRFAMIGMGSVVTRSIPDFHLAIGHPARTVGYVCRCGQPMGSVAEGDQKLVCAACNRAYRLEGQTCHEL